MSEYFRGFFRDFCTAMRAYGDDIRHPGELFRKAFVRT